VSRDAVLFGLAVCAGSALAFVLAARLLLGLVGGISRRLRSERGSTPEQGRRIQSPSTVDDVGPDPAPHEA